ncbi:Homeobox protein knotted-1-like 1 [Melia azedarach]|uniref:Homeobox protein knotted-1-like 1 n=1 Tax=Melia azedarach TaxID=155640 RepID=A0ACC1XQ12_MELAZ|nr:Homeobox protein knotted-1-like 1 [Melia azedarach]
MIAAEQKHKKKVMEDKSSSSSSSRNRKEEEIEILKRRISSHPLYGLLLENHMDCLKVTSILNEEGDQGMNIEDKQRYKKPSSSMHSSSELDLDLDQFMEAYCWALRELKEAIKEPQQETLEFIDKMHSQLTELTITNPAPPPNTSSGERD